MHQDTQIQTPISKEEASKIAAGLVLSSKGFALVAHNGEKVVLVLQVDQLDANQQDELLEAMQSLIHPDRQ